MVFTDPTLDQLIWTAHRDNILDTLLAEPGSENRVYQDWLAQFRSFIIPYSLRRHHLIRDNNLALPEGVSDTTFTEFGERLKLLSERYNLVEFQIPIDLEEEFQSTVQPLTEREYRRQQLQVLEMEDLTEDRSNEVFIYLAQARCNATLNLSVIGLDGIRLRLIKTY